VGVAHSFIITDKKLDFKPGKKSLVILILTNLGATTESCPYKYGKFLSIIGDFRGVGAGLRARPVKISFS
jgi:hypothetical protein